MLRHFRNALALLAVIWGSSTYATDSAKTPVVAIISFIDPMKETDGYIRGVERLYQRMLPNHTVKVFTGHGARSEMIDQLATKIAKADLITHLFIFTHGITEKTLDKEYVTYLEHMGRVYENQGPDEEFKNFFAPIQDKLSPSAAIYLNSCLTMCGSNESVQKRFQHLSQFFRLGDGSSIYGAKTEEYGSGVTMENYLRVAAGFPLAVIGIAFLHNILSGDSPTQISQAIDSASVSLFKTVPSILGGAVVFTLIERFFPILKASLGVYGYLFTQGKAGEISIEDVSKLRDFYKSAGLDRSRLSCLQVSSGLIANEVMAAASK